MKAWTLAAIAGVTLGAVALPKDRAAVMYYSGRDSVISLVPIADSANLALILMTQWRGDSVKASSLAGRPCLGVALFSHGEWAKVVNARKRPEDVRPQDAALRIRIYPATAAEPIAIQDLAAGETYHGVGIDFEFLRKENVKITPDFFRFVDDRLRTLRGKCTAE